MYLRYQMPVVLGEGEEGRGGEGEAFTGDAGDNGVI